MFGKERLPCQISLLCGKVICSNSSLPGAGPLSNVNLLYKCRFPLQIDNFYSVFKASPVSAVSPNNWYAKEAYFRVAYSATPHFITASVKCC